MDVHDTMRGSLEKGLWLKVESTASPTSYACRRAVLTSQFPTPDLAGGHQGRDYECPVLLVSIGLVDTTMGGDTGWTLAG